MTDAPRRTPEPPGAGWEGLPSFPEAVKVELEQRPSSARTCATPPARSGPSAAVRAAEVDNWEELRTAAAQIKDRVGRHLDTYLSRPRRP